MSPAEGPEDESTTIGWVGPKAPTVDPGTWELDAVLQMSVGAPALVQTLGSPEPSLTLMPHISWNAPAALNLLIRLLLESAT